MTKKYNNDKILISKKRKEILKMKKEQCIFCKKIYTQKSIIKHMNNAICKRWQRLEKIKESKRTYDWPIHD